MAAPAPIDELRHRYAAQPRRYFAPLANALRHAGALEEAVTMLRAQLAEHPDHLTGHVVLGQALFDAGALADARGAFEAARALDPGNRVVLQYLGEIASLAGDPAGARLWFGRSRAAGPYADDIAAQLGGGASAPPDVDDEVVENGAGAVEAAREVHEAPPEADHVAAEPFELLEFAPVARPHEERSQEELTDEAADATGPGDPFGATDVAPAPLDPVVGLDLAPAAPPAELEGAPDAAPSAEAATAAGAPPDDDATVLGQITAGPFATETMAGLLAAQGHTQQAIAVYERLVAERPADAALRARRDALRGVTDVVELPADDAARGALLAAAFADVGGATPVTRATETDSEPAPAEAPVPALDPFADVSFDRFFADAAPDADPDLARFDAWLREAA